MTMFVNLNIVSASASHHATTGRPFSPIMPSAIAEEDAEDDDLQDVAFGHRIDDRVRDRVQQDLVPRLRGGGDRRTLPHRQVHTDARPREVDGEQTDDQRERRDDLEVDQRTQPHPADDLEVARAGDAGHQRREDQRRDHHLDQPEEQLAEWPEVDGPGRVVRLDQRHRPRCRAPGR